MPTPRAFAGWRSLSRSGPTSDVPCRSIGTLMSIPCSTRELSSCLRTFVLDVAHFRLRPAPRIVCVVIHLREPERGFRNPYLRDLDPSLETPVVVSRCHRFVRSVHLSPRIVFTTSTGFPGASCNGMDSDARLRPRIPVSRTPWPPCDCTPLPRQRPRSSEW
jgi:hypothetical protein